MSLDDMCPWYVIVFPEILSFSNFTASRTAILFEESLLTIWKIY